MRGRRQTPGGSRTTPTLADVAEAAGVSVATASRVINRSPTVAKNLVDRVSAAVAAVDYVPNSAGRALRRQRSDLWAAVIPDVHNAFFTSIVEAFEAVAARAGYSVVLCNTQEDHERERRYIATAVSLQVSGVLISATQVSYETLRPLVQAGIQTVVMDRRIEGFEGASLTVDNISVGRLAGAHLVGQGYRSALMVSGPVKVPSTSDREVGFQQALTNAGMKFSGDRILRLNLTGQDVGPALRDALAARPDVDCVFAVNGPLTAEAFLTLRESGRQIPQEIGLVGVDDDHWTQMVSPSVTVVAQPTARLGEMAGQIMVGATGDHSLRGSRIVLDPVLRERESSKRI